MSNGSIHFFLIAPEDLSLRLDKLLCLKFPEVSRTYLQSLIEKGHIRINQKICKKRELPKCGDEISIYFEITPELSLEPENIPLDILFEDEELLIVNKPAGMVVHPAPGHFQGTFVNALLFHCRSLPEVGGSLRPGIVHRLDKDTSGVLIAAKTSQTHKNLVSLFSARQIHKTYKAICLGTPKVTEIDAPIKRHPKKRQEMACLEEGKTALTKLHIIASTPLLSLLNVSLITGRTHQIRVHLKHIECPILGDVVYGKESANTKWGITRQLLHAEQVKFLHPKTGQEICVQAPLPNDMQECISKFFSPNL